MKNLLIFTFIVPFLSFSQMTELEVRKMVNSASEPELLMMSSQMMQQNYLYHAEIIVDKLLSLQPESSNYNYRKGYLELTGRNDYESSIIHFGKAVLDTDGNYDMYSVKEKSAPTDAYYHLAKSYHLDQQLDEAVKYYNLFLENSRKKSRLIQLSELGIQQCDVARREIANPKNARVKNIGNVVNGDTPDYAPVVSLDGNSLYFTSRRPWADGSSDQYRDPQLNNYPEDIFVSYTDFEGEWTSPEKLAFCDNQMNEATISVSSDERRIYVYQDVTGGGDIYYSDFATNKFDALEAANYNEMNTENWETHCTITPDGQNVYFVSDRPGGFGGRDIYRLVKLPNGEWSKAMNMGPTINTPYDEDSPFIAVNNNTLYFASNGPTSMGGFDIFVTFRDEENQWSEPANLGYPINSTGDDIYYTTTVDGLKGYLSSFRKDGYGEKDIYEIQNDYLGNRPISSLRGSFVSTDGSPLSENLDVKIICMNCENDGEKSLNPRVKNGSFFGVLSRCKDYEIQYFDGETLLAKESFVTACNSSNEEIEMNHYIGKYLMAGSVADSKSLEYLANSTVEFIDPTSNKIVETYTTDEKGAFNSNLLEGKNFGDKIEYLVQVSKKGYLKQSFVLDTTLGIFATLQLDYLINKSDIGIDIGQIFNLNPIYFDLDKSDIRTDAAIELDKIVKIMNDNPEIKIELGSHTDCRASKSYNASLSKRRAISSADYIKERISNPARIYGKGYGESQLVNDCGCEGNVTSDCSEDEHQANRRTEFRIVKN